MRLGLSALNSHRYDYNSIPTPTCNCQQAAETTQHFFFDCQSYQVAHITFLDRLKNEINLDSNVIDKTNLVNIILHGLVDHEHHETLLNITTRYLQDTCRFR